MRYVLPVYYLVFYEFWCGFFFFVSLFCCGSFCLFDGFFPFGFFFLSFIFVLLFVGGFCLFGLIGGASSFKVPSAVIKALVESHSSVTS